MGATNLVATSLTAVATFAATNIDDIVLLMLWFSQTGQTLRGRQIVAGQYLGFVALVAVSLLGFLGALVIPPAWVGLLGLVPIALGLRRLWRLRAGDGGDEEVSAPHPADSPSAAPGPWGPQTYAVAAVTFANGGDNLGIYIPLFASSTLRWSKSIASTTSAMSVAFLPIAVRS